MDITIYLKILRDTVEDWKDEDEHSFEVIFPIEVEEKINKLLR